MFEYNGVKITVNGEGKFLARVGGKLVSRPSLPAIKKLIDKKTDNEFKPFGVIVEGRNHPSTIMANIPRTALARIVCVGVTEEGRGWRKRRIFQLAGGHIAYGGVYKDCPETIDLWIKKDKKETELSKLRAKLEKEIGAIEDKLGKLKIDPGGPETT